MKVAVAGCGAIGLRHLRNLVTLGVQEIVAHDPNASALTTAVAGGAQPCTTLDDLLATAPDAVLVCTPPNDHVMTARAAIDAGAHVLIEKPIAVRTDGVRDLLEAARAGGRVIAVGYNLHFDEGLCRVKRILDAGEIGRPLGIRAEFGQYLPDWRPKQDYRLGFTGRASEGGGIVMDASHELDYVRWLVGDPAAVYAVTGRFGDLDVDVEDTMAVIMRMPSDIVAEIHADFLQRAYERCCKVAGTEGTVAWSVDEGVRVFTARDGIWRPVHAALDRNAAFIEELRHFLHCVATGERPRVSGEDGLRALEIALAVKRSAAEHREIAMPQRHGTDESRSGS